MTGIIDRSTVQQYQVLSRLAATHLVAARGLILALDSRQQLDALENILLAKERRHLGQRSHLYLLHPDLYLLDALLGRPRRDGDLL